MPQEAQALELDRAARLVGNFASEKELYLMLGRFSRQLHELPESLLPGENVPGVGGADPGLLSSPADNGEVFISPDGEEGSAPEDSDRVEEILSLLRMTLEREIGREDLETAGRQALAQLMEDVRKKDFEKLNRFSPKCIIPCENVLYASGAVSNVFFVRRSMGISRIPGGMKKGPMNRNAFTENLKISKA